MEKENREQTIEDIKRMIVNHPVQAYKNIGVDIAGAINDNSEIILETIKGMFAGGVLIVKNMTLFIRCTLMAICHIFFLAFYPCVKVYYILGARREIMRENPEYKQPRQRGQKRKR